MSLAIDINKIEKVLLADGWHEVKNKSFIIDAYEYVDKENEEGISNGGQDPRHISTTGASWIEEYNKTNYIIYVPINSILAINHKSKFQE